MKHELTSQQAAEHLGVSRQFVEDEAEAGRLPYYKVDGHYQFQFQDVLAYKNKLEVESLEARKALADEAQRLGLGD
jgi:excisionase family DNA binding protein